MSQAKFDDLRERLAEISDLVKTAALLGWDQHVMMPPEGSVDPRRAAGDGRAHRPHEVHLARDRQAARRPARLGRAAGLRLVRGEPDPRQPPATGRSRARCRRSCAPRCRARPRSRTRCGSTRARTNDFKTLPARPAQEPRPAQALHRLLRGEGRAVRHRPRRLRARHDDEGSPAHLRLPEGAPGTARQGGRGARRQRRQAARVLARGPEDVRARGRARRSATPTTRGGSTRRCIRSRPARASPTSASRRATSRITSAASSGRCTSSATASTSARSIPTLERSPLARGVSLGMHESQSRMWENLVGRSLPFWRHFFPRLQELLPDARRRRRRVSGTAR